MKKTAGYLEAGFLSLLILIAIPACTGRMAKVDESWIKDTSATPPTEQKIQIPFSVADNGIEIYKGHPSTIGYKTWGVTVDLKSIQEIAARTVLRRIPESPSEKQNNIQVQSYITDFQYKWPFPWPTKRAYISFTAHIDVIKDNKTLFSRTVEVKDFEGSETKRFLIPPEIILDKLYTKMRGFEHERSEMVAKATMEAVYQVYQREIPRLIDQV